MVAEHEVDAQPLVAREAQLLVVPEGEALGRQRPHDVAQPDGFERCEGLALGR